jgi:Uma2 family endonuclease
VVGARDTVHDMAVAARRSPAGPLTWRDLWRTPDDGKRYEIIDGVLYVSPAPVPLHQRVLRALFLVLNRHVTRHQLGEVFFAPIGIVLEVPSAVQPDLVFIGERQGDIVKEKAVFGAPDLLVEVLSPSSERRDRSLKRRTYERCGVAHYWVVDPRRRRLHAWRAEGGRYVVDAELAGDARFRPALFPRLTIRLADVWAGRG